MSRESIGVDVSKSSLDVYSTASGRSEIFENNAKGVSKFLRWSRSESVDLVCLEATGPYSRLLLRQLEENQIPFLVVNPKRLRRFAQGLGKLAKTDKLDAQVIATYGKKSDDPLSKLRTREEEVVKDLCTRRNQLSLMITQEENRLQVTEGDSVRSIEETLSFLRQQLRSVTKLIEQKLRESHEMNSKAELLRSVKGVGPVTSAVLLSFLPELGTLDKKAAASLCGLAPFNRDSGQFRGKQAIYGGRTPVRSALYMASLTAARYNPTFNDFYLRLLKHGKPKKVALIAVARKLVVILNAILRDGEPWREPTQMVPLTKGEKDNSFSFFG